MRKMTEATKEDNEGGKEDESKVMWSQTSQIRLQKGERRAICDKRIKQERENGSRKPRRKVVF